MTNFGPLACSIATTTRKFFTILASVVIFGHSLLTRQWIGTVLVFIGLALDTVYGKETKSSAAPTATTHGMVANGDASHHHKKHHKGS